MEARNCKDRVIVMQQHAAHMRQGRGPRVGRRRQLGAVAAFAAADTAAFQELEGMEEERVDL